MRRGWAILVGAALGAGMLAALAAPGFAAEADGCSGSATSVTKDGESLDTVQGPGQGGTKSDPFEVDPRGRVDWEGQSDGVIQDGSWKVKLNGIQVSTGDINNDDGSTDDSGTQSVKKMLVKKVPLFGEVVLFTGLVKAEVEATGAGGATCTASGFIKIKGSVTSTPIFYVGAGLTALGALLFFFSAPTAQATSAPAAAGLTASKGGAL